MKSIVSNLAFFVEQLFGRLVGEKVPTPIFIVGPPRSGTTLLFQCITEWFDVGYTTNKHARLPSGISITEKVLHPLRDRVSSTFKSEFGKTEHGTEPNECGEYWYQFFSRKPHFVEMVDLPHSKTFELRHSMAAIQGSFGKPVVFKNVINSARVGVLKSVFPNAVFIEMLRDPDKNVDSILRARSKSGVSALSLWSLEPEGIVEKEFKSETELVNAQVNLTRKMLEKSFRDFDRVISVSYEDLCRDPHNALNRIDRAFQDFGFCLSKRENSTVPLNF